jgi:hypothetical protein
VNRRTLILSLFVIGSATCASAADPAAQNILLYDHSPAAGPKSFKKDR